jgi:hypothetical protein
MFSGGSVLVSVEFDAKGRPTAGSAATYFPAGIRDDLQMNISFPIGEAPPHRLGAPSDAGASALVDPSRGRGEFVLALAGKTFGSTGSGPIAAGVPSWQGKVQASNWFKTGTDLAEAIKAGGPAKLVFRDSSSEIASADLTFAKLDDLQDAARKAFEGAAAFAADAKQSEFCQ